MKYTSYIKEFTPARLWRHIERNARKAGRKLVYVALMLYYIAMDPKTPKKDKAVIFGVLGYFIMPFDFIPDVMPFVGFSDDLTALISVLRAFAGNATPEIHAKVRQRIAEWFDGPAEDADVIEY